MARKEDKQPQYLPLIVKAKLHTGGRDYEKIKEELKGQGFTCKQMKGMVREGNYFDGIVLYLSKWNWDNHESWHLYNWDDKDDKEVMLGIYEAETQTAPALLHTLYGRHYNFTPRQKVSGKDKE